MVTAEKLKTYERAAEEAQAAYIRAEKTGAPTASRLLRESEMMRDAYKRKLEEFAMGAGGNV